MHDLRRYLRSGIEQLREIDIEFESITHLATRMRVVVSKGAFFLRDGATGAEIIARTVETLDHQTARADLTHEGR